MLIFLGQFLKIVRRFLNKHYWGAVLFVLIWTPHQMGQYKTQFDDPHIGATIPAKGMTADVVPQESGISPFDRPVFRAMDFLTASEGWAFFDQQLYWTKDGGATWTEIKPRKEDEPILLTPFFMDTTNGWIATYANQQFVISQTTDGGITWNDIPFSAVEVENYLAFADYLAFAEVYLDFRDENIGWMTLKFATGINFSWGLLFFTQDGGKTWVERTVPLGEPVDFINENVGWVAGGPMGNQLFKTEDGGLTWQAVQVVGEQASSNQFILKLPVFSNEQEGFIPVLFLGERRTDVTVYVTTDGGTTWTSTDREVMQQAFRPQNIITLTTMNWLMTNHAQSLRSRDGLYFVDFVNPHVGWTYHQNSPCLPAICPKEYQLLQTVDGGESWIERAIPGFEE